MKKLIDMLTGRDTDSVGYENVDTQVVEEKVTKIARMMLTYAILGYWMISTSTVQVN